MIMSYFLDKIPIIIKYYCPKGGSSYPTEPSLDPPLTLACTVNMPCLSENELWVSNPQWYGCYISILQNKYLDLFTTSVITWPWAALINIFVQVYNFMPLICTLCLSRFFYFCFLCAGKLEFSNERKLFIFFKYIFGLCY